MVLVRAYFKKATAKQEQSKIVVECVHEGQATVYRGCPFQTY